MRVCFFTMKFLKHLRTDWFKYGFETMAVIVGILAAFALDNWNEERKQQIQETRYLESLLADLVADSAYYNRRMGDSEGVIADNSYSINQMYRKQASLEEVKDLISTNNWNSEQLTTQNSSYVDLTNSGSLSIIGNQDLKESIINYYRENEQVAAHILEFNEVSSRHLVEVGNVIPNYGKLHHISDDLYMDKSMYREDEWLFINDPTSFKFQTLEYALHAYRIKHMEFLAHFRTLKDLSAALIESIKEELDSR